jgi:hypothetical protein
MALIRPELATALLRGREVIAALIVALAGLWLIWLGGYLLAPLGAAVAVFATLWAVQAWRRVRFAQAVAAPGMVEVDEGQVGYLGPTFGGFVALPDLVELRILTLQGRRLWRLKQADGQALLIPVDAEGAERLFDAFGTLPGMDTQALVGAIGPGPGTATGARAGAPADETARIGRLLWRRPGHAALR